MYRTIITFKDFVSEDMLMLNSLKKQVEWCFCNRGGTAVDVSNSPNQMIFEGGEELWGCLHLGILGLNKLEDFKDCVETWHWIDEEEPSESCNIMEELAMPIY